VDTQRLLQCIISKQALPNNRRWRYLASVTDLVGTNGLCAVNTSLRNCLVLLGTGWLQSRHISDRTQTSFLSFTCTTYKHK
jgi:hypothetical protein